MGILFSLMIWFKDLVHYHLELSKYILDCIFRHYPNLCWFLPHFVSDLLEVMAIIEYKTKLFIIRKREHL